MRHGRVVEHGDTDAVLFQPTDPYTRALFSAVPGRTPTAMEEAER
jgi:ABC-type oligopeptide transport system ATPase subunit